jgi:hypothetical protein
MSQSNTNTKTQTRTSLFTSFIAIILPVIMASTVLYRLDTFKPIHFPLDKLTRSTITAPLHNKNMRLGSENVAKGQVLGPEDLLYDAALGVVYTGCEDGWIKRITVNESVVEDWINTGGRPLGLAFDPNGALIVADARF